MCFGQCIRKNENATATVDGGGRSKRVRDGCWNTPPRSGADFLQEAWECISHGYFFFMRKLEPFYL